MSSTIPTDASRAHRRLTRARTNRDTAEAEIRRLKERLSVLAESMEEDPELRPMLQPQHARAQRQLETTQQDAQDAQDAYEQARRDYDTTPTGQNALRARLDDSTVDEGERRRLTARLAYATERYEQQTNRYRASSEYPYRRFKDTIRSSWPVLCDELAAARCAEQGVAWPPPAEGSPTRQVWDSESYGRAYQQLVSLVGPQWAATTFMLDDVIDASTIPPAYEGHTPILDAHWANLPPVVIATNPMWGMHAHAWTGIAWKLDVDEFTQIVQACGSSYTSATDTHWDVLPVVCPFIVDFTDADHPDDDPYAPSTVLVDDGWVGVSEAGHVQAWPTIPQDLTPL